MPSPQPTRRLLLSPTERAEILVDLRPGERPVLRSLAWDLGMITPLTNGAGGHDHLDLLQLGAGNSLADSGHLPERLETNPAVALIMSRLSGRSSSMAARSADQPPIGLH